MKKYNDRKICFIICTNDELQLQECLLYLSLLEVPEGYETELLTITDAKSMTSGYNEGMNASDAKYKIYLHHDTFIVDPLFLVNMLKVFKRSRNIGMMGIIGAEKLSKDGVMWHEKRCGNFYQLDQMIASGFDGIELIKRGMREVEVVDGFLMATQYDIPWREDILTGWDFYDVSQCMEFRRAGYKVVVPAQKDNWVIHACDAPSFWHYNKNREIVLKEYPEIGQATKNRLRIVCFHSVQITLIGLPYYFADLGHSVTIPEGKVNLDGCSESDVEWVEEILEEGHYDLVFTYDFSSGVSVACQNMNVKYYSWVYDSPLLELYSKRAFNDVNYISAFDKKQYERLSAYDFKHLFYLPLAADVECFGSVSVKKRDIRKYTSDVVFVGRMYDNRGYDELFDATDTEIKKEADEVVASCGCRWDGETSIFGVASDRLIEHIVSKQPENTWKEWDIDKRYFCESMKLVRKCNEIERTVILNTLAEKYNVVLYSDESPKKMLHNVEVRPWLDYIDEMPKVFYLSKINLNITSRSIESGIPQRIWDILSVGGFCITNYQPELEDFFEIGKDLEVYHNVDELVEKVGYYLTHEEERLRIAINGYQTVRTKHNSKERLKYVLNYIFGDLEEGNGDF